MNIETAVKLYPIVVIQDRYGGVYSGGEWLAVANSDERFEGTMRATWLVETGPSGSDPDAAGFWQEPPPWIAAGATPDLAIEKLVHGMERDGRRA